jgi:hypothetical protein
MSFAWFQVWGRIRLLYGNARLAERRGVVAVGDLIAEIVAHGTRPRIGCVGSSGLVVDAPTAVQLQSPRYLQKGLNVRSGWKLAIWNKFQRKLLTFHGGPRCQPLTDHIRQRVLLLARIQAFPVLAIVSPEGPRGPAELLLNFVIASRNVLGEGK